MPFAEAALADWAPVLGTIVNVGFAALVGWYLLTKAIPKMQDDFRGEMAATRAGADASAQALRIDHKATVDAVFVHCEREMQRRDLTFTAEMNLIQNALTDQAEVLEGVRIALVEITVRLKV